MIKSEYDEGEHPIVDEYIEFLSEKEIIFFTSNPDLFPSMSNYWQEPAYITNAILDFNLIDLYCLTFLLELRDLGCKHIQLRIFDNNSPTCVEALLDKVHSSQFESIEILLPFSHDINIDLLKKWCTDFKTISIITVYDFLVDQYFHFQPNTFGNIFFSTANVHGCKSCGIIQESLFTVNIKTFTEAQQHNTCLNRKIAIDVDGNIKNCPSMPQSYGNIKDTTLKEALEHPDFKKYWYIHKDQIEVCKDCEFRYICTDCRAYLEDPHNLYSKPLKCGYNPYTGEWEEWSTNPLKQKAIEYYGMQELVKKETD